MDKKAVKKGPAPFASIEDLSDESPPEEKTRLEVPGSAREAGPPRIDISRASSSSHHEDSSPERELFAGEGGGNVKLGLGFTEEMALELRSSTEELDFHEPDPEPKSRRKKLQQQQAVVVTKYELEADSDKEARERKDSGCSEGGLLYIGGGRTSRLSSIGSAASGGSGVSGCSGVSHLSAVSNLSRASRCSSPHKMLLETSFCGPKPIPSVSLEAEYPPSDCVEAALLRRKGDPAGAVLPSGVVTACLVVRGDKPRRTSSERTVRQTPLIVTTQPRSNSARVAKRPPKGHSDDLVRIIPLHGSLDEPEDEEPSGAAGAGGGGDEFNPENGIYIPIKGPIIDTRGVKKQDGREQEEEERGERRKRPPEMEDSDLFQFISLHGDDDEDVQRSVQFKTWADNKELWRDWPKPRSPEAPKPGRLELGKKNGRSLGQIPRDDSRTPSPASSFSRGNIFRRSSDSSGSSKKSAGSGDSKKKDSKNKSMFSSLFKKNIKEHTVHKGSQQDKAPIDPKLTNVEYKFRQEEHVIDEDTIIIPLHAPGEIVEPLILNVPEPEVEQNDLSRDKSSQNLPEIQRYSMEGSAIEKNIVVVDVINEDTKDSPFEKKPETLSPRKQQLPSPRVKKVDELEIQTLECEPRVRRSSSSSCREVEVLRPSMENVETKKEPEAVKSEESVKKEEVVIVKNMSQKSDESIQSLSEEKRLSESESTETDRQASVETVIENHLAIKEEETVNKNEEKRTEVSLERNEETESLIKRESDSESVRKTWSLEARGERQSSESEVEVEAGPGMEKEAAEVEECDEERKGLFHQTDSVEDELPYVPTTLPQERSVALPIIPIRQRVTEVKTCPVDRPRSTTPIQPSNLEEYAATQQPMRPSLQEKMQITLPRTDSSRSRGGRGGGGSPPPPLPPRAPQWVGFDEPERRRPPRRITTLPYTYVNPEECTCECHEVQGRDPNPNPPPTCAKPDQCTLKSPRTEKEKRYRT